MLLFFLILTFIDSIGCRLLKLWRASYFTNTGKIVIYQSLWLWALSLTSSSFPALIIVQRNSWHSGKTWSQRNNSIQLHSTPSIVSRQSRHRPKRKINGRSGNWRRNILTSISLCVSVVFQNRSYKLNSLLVLWSSIRLFDLSVTSILVPSGHFMGIRDMVRAHVVALSAPSIPGRDEWLIISSSTFNCCSESDLSSQIDFRRRILYLLQWLMLRFTQVCAGGSGNERVCAFVGIAWEKQRKDIWGHIGIQSSINDSPGHRHDSPMWNAQQNEGSKEWWHRSGLSSPNDWTQMTACL